MLSSNERSNKVLIKTKYTNMRKSTLLLTVLLSAIVQLALAKKTDSGVKPAFDKGSKTLGLCVGVGVNYDYYGTAVQLPALGIVYDQGIIPNVGPGTIGIGGLLAFKTAHYNYSSGGYKATWTNYIVGVRGTYHLTILKDKNNKFDPYAGVLLGVRIFRYNDTYYNTWAYNPYSYGGAYFTKGVFVGAKYNFSKNFGAFAEFGYDISNARIGLNFNF